MKRTAVGAICALVALCTSALGVGYYTWGWEKEQPNDSVYDESDASELWLTQNNGSHAVAMGYQNDWWTGVVAAVAPPGTGEQPSDSITAYEWGLGRYDENQDNKWPYHIWTHGNEYPHPARACVAANNYYKLWLSAAYDWQGVYKNMCNAATDHLWSQDVDDRDHLTDALHVNYDHQLAGVCFPDNSQRMVAAYTDNRSDGPNWGLLANTTTSHGGTWSDWIEVLDYQFGKDEGHFPYFLTL
jgi:hypothetical protein